MSQASRNTQRNANPTGPGTLNVPNPAAPEVVIPTGTEQTFILPPAPATTADYSALSLPTPPEQRIGISTGHEVQRVVGEANELCSILDERRRTPEGVESLVVALKESNSTNPNFQGVSGMHVVAELITNLQKVSHNVGTGAFREDPRSFLTQLENLETLNVELRSRLG